MRHGSAVRGRPMSTFNPFSIQNALSARRALKYVKVAR